MMSIVPARLAQDGQPPNLSDVTDTAWRFNGRPGRVLTFNGNQRNDKDGKISMSSVMQDVHGTVSLCAESDTGGRPPERGVK